MFNIYVGIRYIFILLLCSCSSLSFAAIIGWDSGVSSSLRILEYFQLERKDIGIVLEKGVQSGYIRTEDIILGTDSIGSKLFVRFDKKNYNSCIQINIVDSLTGDILSSVQFDESGEIVCEPTIQSMRIHIVAEVFGHDVTLYKFGLYSYPRKIMEEEDFTISSDFLLKNTDILQTNITLQELAEVSLFLYDSTGNICYHFLKNQVLALGSYEFFWDPCSLKNLPEGEQFYVWIYLKNSQNNTESYVKTFFVVPEGKTACLIKNT